MSTAASKCLWREGALAYALLWALTGTTAILALPFAHQLRYLIGLRLARSKSPHLAWALGICAHNLRVAAIPLLCAALGVGQSRRLRAVADALIATTLTVNVALGGLALGAYGLRLLPYLAHMPAEWGGLAAATGAWLIARHRPILRPELLLLAGATLACLSAGGLLETYATPHA